MIIELTNTSSAEVASQALTARRSTGVASGLVMTLIVASTTRQYSDAFDAAQATAVEHPSRIIVVIEGSRERPTAMDAEIRVGEGTPGDMITLRLTGDLVGHGDSVVLPLLLPDLPVVAWWPGRGPELPGKDPIGALAQRRITDAANADDPIAALVARASGEYSGADTDLSWTRLTRWRALAASALDQCRLPVRSAIVEAAADNAPAELFAAWLDARLEVPVEVKSSMGPGLTAVRLQTEAGEVAVRRERTADAAFVIPGQPVRTAALGRRSAVALLSEELRRLDPDAVFAQALGRLAERAGR
ncbi:glucose-6-phosphate dehydrogenase assembly protein OpcA [uncultured Propionibacterium sp.]|uniref:glucose-6-phosphate dehydrogenase assembly protein OpcA n=1 Tax=uncultured Propionibacterium sp. TaxID=218066 RepID=UPI00292D22D9|nr:glucose-6-phosphate dehydrogenase assembly protein OpcA [uncultured Propionibacterium sp.]